MSDNVLDRVLSRAVETASGCWEFQGYRLARGYGRVGWNGRLWLTHRVTYLHLIGEIPVELELDHLCVNPPCCNPWHLEPVSRSENIRRGTQWVARAKFESAKTVCPRGHPYDSDNTYITPRGHRQCRLCKRSAYTRYAAANRSVIAARARDHRARIKELA